MFKKLINVILKIIHRQIKTVDFNDTFLSFDHLRHSFPRYDVKVENQTSDDVKNEVKLIPPFRVTFNEGSETEKPSIGVEPVVKEKRGPYSFNAPKKNNIPFTPTQVEAIRSGINPGLTLIVGPPGNFFSQKNRSFSIKWCTLVENSEDLIFYQIFGKVSVMFWKRPRLLFEVYSFVIVTEKNDFRKVSQGGLFIL